MIIKARDSLFRNIFVVQLIAGIVLVAIGAIFANPATTALPRQDEIALRTIKTPSTNAVLPPAKHYSGYKILALRVDFIKDTLETTTGNGKFQYEPVDTAYFDPPPHDSLYFDDYLEFLEFYWNKMSGGAIERIDRKIYPAGMQAAYHLPNQMWHYNYNSSDEQLDYGLAELFRDAIQAADEDPAIDWEEYDNDSSLVMIFHAGAGAEFDLGYTLTPHDIPSAWLTGDDLDTLGFDSQGIPVDNGNVFIPGGIILPETETHDEVQISMTGVICSMFGHWLGLPALYDNDEDREGVSGNPVVGKWSLMDRGFGNYYGAIPGYLDAWSRSYMGWLEPQPLEPGEHSIRTMDAESDYDEAYRIDINQNEYFLLSCRNRDPENDSVAVAYDREGRQMTFLDDYTVELDDGFRVPVRIDNLDFDSPGSGILIWHVDEALRSLIPDRRFNSVDSWRGLDLEEADGAQDIGQNYAFLTPGYGTDYGIMADAFYRDNDYHRDANQGRPVSFNNSSNPSSLSKSGVFTNITIDNFSDIDSVMSFTYTRTRAPLFTIDRATVSGSTTLFTTGNFDDNPDDDEIVLVSRDTVRFYDGTGDMLYSMEILQSPLQKTLVVRDLNEDGIDDVIWAGKRSSHEQVSLIYTGLISNPFNNFDHRTIQTSEIHFLRSCHVLLAGGSGFETTLYATFTDNQGSRLSTFSSELNQLSAVNLDVEIESLHRYGTAESDSILIVTDSSEVYIWHQNEINYIENSNPSPTLPGNRVHTILMNTDANSLQDLFLHYYDDDGQIGTFFRIFRDVSHQGWSETISRDYPDEIEIPYNDIIPLDIDHDDRFELMGIGTEFRGLEQEAGTIAENSIHDRALPAHMLLSDISDIAVADLNGSNRWDYVIIDELQSVDSENGYASMISVYREDGSLWDGYPQNLKGSNGQIRLCQLDDNPDLEMVVLHNQSLEAYDPGFRGEREHIWWQGDYRDNDNSNAIWEHVKPFEPPADNSILQNDLCYNWPNPAKGHTWFRFFLNREAAVTITIYDVTGEQIHKIPTTSGEYVEGVHHERIWDLTNIPRGAYIAILEATADGKTESKKIKVAVY